MATGTIGEPARNVPVFGEFDVVVLGGGPAGIAAAAAAGKSGRSTLIVERYGHLGGSGTVAGLSNFCGLHANVHGEMKQVVHGVADEILERLARMESLDKPHMSLGNKILAQVYDMSAYKIASEEMLADAGVAILYHAFGVGAIMESPQRVSTLLVETKSGRRAVIGRVFIDASGDADLAAWAGAPFEKGDDIKTMAFPSTKFMINGVDPVLAGDAWNLIPKLMDEAERNGAKFPRRGAIVRPARNPVEWRANVTQVRNRDGTPVDGTDADELSFGETEGRRQAWLVFDFIRKNTPGFENAYISEIFALGIRETRRLVGLYSVTEDDVLGCASFGDTVGVSGWPVEQHLAGDVRIAFPPIPESRGFHHLPYRMLVSPAVENLLVAGRCASMSHDGQSAARVSGPCFAMGQAAGTAADLALTHGVAARDIDVAQLQSRLTAEGAFLGRAGESIADFTPTRAVRSTSPSRRTALTAFAAFAAAAGAGVPLRARAADAVRVASVPSDGGMELAYGIAQGFAAQQQLTPQLSVMGNGSAMIAAMLGGDMDVVMVNVISLLQAYEKGVPIAMIAPGIIYSTNAPQEVLMVAKTSTARTAHDLEGKRVAVDGLRNSTQLGTMAWMYRNGADSSSVKWVELPFPQMGSALTAGRVDAALMTEPYATQTKDDVQILAKAFDAIAPQFCLTAWCSSRAWAAAHPDIARRFASVIYRTAEWANRNQKTTAHVLAEGMHLSPAVVAAMPRAAFAERNDPALFRPIVDVAVKYKVLDGPVALGELLAAEVAH